MFLHSLHFVTVKVQSRCQTGSAKLTNIFPAALSPLRAFVSGFCSTNMWPAHSSRNLFVFAELLLQPQTSLCCSSSHSLTNAKPQCVTCWCQRVAPTCGFREGSVDSGVPVMLPDWVSPGNGAEQSPDSILTALTAESTSRATPGMGRPSADTSGQ